MKRQVALVGIGLLAGLGAGFALGLRYSATTATPGTPTRGASAPQPAARADRPATPAGTPQAESVIAADPVAEPRRKLAAWLAAGSPESELHEVFEHLRTWSRTDPDAALEFVRSAARFPRRTLALSIPLAAICQGDPAKVCGWLHGNLPESERGETASMVIMAICKDAPRAALALAEADGIPIDRRFFGRIFTQLVQIAPAEALAAFGRLSEGGREQTAAELSAAWAETDPAAALRWCNSLQGLPGAAEARQGLLLQLARKDPAQAFTLLGQWNLEPEIAARITATIARAQSAFVLEHLSRLPADQQARAASIAVAESFASDPDRITALVRGAIPAEQAAAAIGDAWTRWLRQDRPAAEAWADSVQDPAIRAQLDLLKLRDIADSDPSLFLASVDTLPAAQAERKLIQSALSNLTAEQAGNWIAKHLGLIDPSFAAEVTRNYFEWNRDQAASWVGRLPPGDTQNRALTGLAVSWAYNDNPAKAAAAIGAIGDQRLQTATRFQVFTTLYGKNPSTAVQWLAAQPVDPAIRANWQTLMEATPSATSVDIHYD